MARKIDNSAAQAVFEPVRGTICDKTAIKLEFSERQIMQPRQRGIGGPKIIYGNRHVVEFQLRCDFVDPLAILDHLVLGNLDQQSRKSRVAGQGATNESTEIRRENN